MKDTGKVQSKIPRKIKKFIRKDEVMTKLLYLIAD